MELWRNHTIIHLEIILLQKITKQKTHRLSTHLRRCAAHRHSTTSLLSVVGQVAGHGAGQESSFICSESALGATMSASSHALHSADLSGGGKISSWARITCAASLPNRSSALAWFSTAALIRQRFLTWSTGFVPTTHCNAALSTLSQQARPLPVRPD